MNITTRHYLEKDINNMRNIWNEIVRDGTAFPQKNELTYNEAKKFFSLQSYCGIAENSNGQIQGMYILHPNNVGRCRQIANASFAVAKLSRGCGIGEVLVRDCIRQAKQLDFKILQFNAVVATNESAIKLYKKLGFKQLGVIPKCFEMADGIYEDIIPHYIEL